MYHNPADFVFEVMAKEKENHPNFFSSLWQRRIGEIEVAPPSKPSINRGKDWGREDEKSGRLDADELSLDMEEVNFDFSTSWFRQFYTLFRRSCYMTLTDKQVDSLVVLTPSQLNLSPLCQFCLSGWIVFSNFEGD
jgi:hypothetical protein